MARSRRPETRHPAVDEIVRRRREGDTSGSSATNPSALATHTASLTDADFRAFKVLDRIVAHLVTLGFDFEAGALGWLTAKRQEVWIAFRVREVWRKPKSGERREAALNKGLIRTGELTAQVGSGQWREDHRGTIEERLPAIFAYVDREIDDSERRQLENVRRQQDAARKDASAAAAARVPETEASVWRRFLESADTADRIVRARALVDRLEALGQGDGLVAGRAISDWVQWLRRRVDEEDPLRDGVEGLLSSLVDEG